MRLHLLCYSVQYLLTVRLPRFFTLHTKCTFLPTKPVIFDGIVVSKYGPVPGVGNSCRKSVKNRLELPKQVPENIPITKQIVFNKCMTNSIFFGSLSSELFAPTLRLLLLLLWNIISIFLFFQQWFIICEFLYKYQLHYLQPTHCFYPTQIVMKTLYGKRQKFWLVTTLWFPIKLFFRILWEESK